MKSGLPVILADLDVNPGIKKDYDFVMDLVAKGKATDHETKHAMAYKECFYGYVGSHHQCRSQRKMLTETTAYRLATAQTFTIDLYKN